jgi:HEAT repeat protein
MHDGVGARVNNGGGRTTLLEITKCGDRYLRTLLIQGARSASRTIARRRAIRNLGQVFSNSDVRVNGGGSGIGEQKTLESCRRSFLAERFTCRENQEHEDRCIYEPASP